MEPKPGIPPSAGDLSALVHLIEQEEVALLLAEPYYPERPLRFLQQHTSVPALRLPLLLGGDATSTTYLDHMASIVDQIRRALADRSGE